MRFYICLALCAVTLLPVAGCSGCRGDDDAKKKQAQQAAQKKKKAAKKKKKPKPDIEELGRLQVQPHTSFRAPRNKEERLKLDKEPVYGKPGHWVNVSHHVRANNRDFHGQLVWQAQHRDERSNSIRPLPFKYAPYRMNASRPVTLSKDQSGEKRVDMTLFMPRLGSQSTMQYQYQGRGGWSARMPNRRIRHMPAHQYFFVVLSSQPNVYQSLKSERSIWTQFRSSGENAHYRVVLMKPDRRTPLPTNSLTWTGIAYLLWDDVDPSVLLPEQQQAMLDWLHWGGQLIVSGPDSLEQLRGSFLEPFLPVRGGKTLELPDEQLASLRGTWPQESGTPLIAENPWPGVELLPAKNEDDSSPNDAPQDDTDDYKVLLSTKSFQPLLVEHRVGRGRVLVSAFRLRQRELRQNWSGFDNFLNSYLMRRPPRHFKKGNVESSALFDPDEDLMEWQGMPARRDDPQLVTNYRAFSRDSGYDYSRPSNVEDYAIDQFGRSVVGDLHDQLRKADQGIGGWSDENAVANSARETIRIVAGIDIPERSFVIQVLLGYLIILVPLNWGLFRIIGRVEWAWFAAPVISIGGALLVIQLAQLDIGFVRSRNELSVVELQSGYPRAHVTRYTALYSSLSTEYALQFADSGALIQPFPMKTNIRPYDYRDNDTVHYRSENHVGFSGFHVISNSTGVLHSEQMVDVGGSISLPHDAGGRIKVFNGTTLPLNSVAVVRRRLESEIAPGTSPFKLALLGDISPGDTAPGTLTLSETVDWIDQWTATVEQDDLQGSGGEVAWKWLLAPNPGFSSAIESRRQMLRFDDLQPGDTRLVAIATEGVIPGLEITPRASQTRNATLVISNLKFGAGQKPGTDNKLPRNSRAPGRIDINEDDLEDEDSSFIFPTGP